MVKRKVQKVNNSEPDIIDKVAPADNIKFGVSKGVTRNMGNYESLRVDVWMTCEPEEGETLHEAFERVDSLLTGELESILDSTK